MLLGEIINSKVLLLVRALEKLPSTELFFNVSSFIITTHKVRNLIIFVFNYRVAFDEDRVPNLYDDKAVLQDIHSVSSLLKMYFRELPNPVCTYHLYEKFVEAAKAPENQRLVLMRDVVQQLPPPYYRYVWKKLREIVNKRCGNFMIFLSLGFCVKSILENVEVVKMMFLPF